MLGGSLLLFHVQWASLGDVRAPILPLTPPPQGPFGHHHYHQHGLFLAWARAEATQGQQTDQGDASQGLITHSPPHRAYDANRPIISARGFSTRAECGGPAHQGHARAWGQGGVVALCLSFCVLCVSLEAPEEEEDTPLGWSRARGAPHALTHPPTHPPTHYTPEGQAEALPPRHMDSLSLPPTTTAFRRTHERASASPFPPPFPFPFACLPGRERESKEEWKEPSCCPLCVKEGERRETSSLTLYSTGEKKDERWWAFPTWYVLVLHPSTHPPMLHPPTHPLPPYNRELCFGGGIRGVCGWETPHQKGLDCEQWDCSGQGDSFHSTLGVRDVSGMGGWVGWVEEGKAVRMRCCG